MTVLPAIPFDEWRPTKETLHRYVQIVGKVALAHGVRRNHWWHMTLRNTPRGWSTMELGRGPVFTLQFDFFDHVLRLRTDAGDEAAVPLGQSVASFYKHVTSSLRAVGVDPAIARPVPYDLPDSARPFAEDHEHDAYVAEHAQRAFLVYHRVGRILEEFSANYSGKVSPVQVFWHSFDIATQRYSAKQVPTPEGMNSATRESYSCEQISSGFWFGDEKTPEPTFYSYTYPDPPHVADAVLRPAAARWVGEDGGRNAYLAYDEVRKADDPERAVLDFYQSVYEAGAERAGWDTGRLACWGGITDPVLRAARP
jgi:hypothetical protein